VTDLSELLGITEEDERLYRETPRRCCGRQVTTLDQKIRQQLIDDAAEQDDAAPVLAAMRYQDALRAVLDLHPVHRLGDRAWCRTCSCTCRSSADQDYACPTVRGIAIHLGITQGDPQCRVT
jgi:hypothetical protein